MTEGRRQSENYGAESVAGNSFADIRSGVAAIFADGRTLALGVTSCFFEGSMYLMVFFWSAVLRSAHEAAPPPPAGAGAGADLPFGLIFSSFMCAMLCGSLFFSLFARRHSRETAVFVLLADLLIASACLSAATVFADERLLFWALCVFEVCVGAYFPSMSYLKSEVVDDGVRGRVYSILRFPLNVFVVVAHSLDQEGERPPSSTARTAVQG